MRRVVERSQVRQHPGELFDLVSTRQVKLSAAGHDRGWGGSLPQGKAPGYRRDRGLPPRDRSLEASLELDALCEGFVFELLAAERG